MFKNRLHTWTLLFAVILLLTVLVTGCGNDKPTYGSWTAPDGSQYKGYLLNDQPEGKGEILIPNGAKYVGDFKKGLFDGKGVLTQPDGSRYEGEFKNGMPNGKGMIIDTKGMKMSGIFKDNVMVKTTLIEPPPIKIEKKKD